MMSVALIFKETQGTQTEIPLLPDTLLRHIVSDVLFLRLYDIFKFIKPPVIFFRMFSSSHTWLAANLKKPI
jgi:hypothetical protein